MKIFVHIKKARLVAGFLFWFILPADALARECVSTAPMAEFPSVLPALPGKVCVLGPNLVAEGQSLAQGYDVTDLDLPTLKESFGKLLTSAGWVLEKEDIKSFPGSPAQMVFQRYLRGEEYALEVVYSDTLTAMLPAPQGGGCQVKLVLKKK